MNMAQGSHLLPPQVKLIPREKPSEKVDQTTHGEAEVLNTDLVDASKKELDYSVEGPNTRSYGVASDLFEDATKTGPSVYGGLDALAGFGRLGPGLENYPKEKYGFDVPNYRDSYEVERRRPLKPKISKENMCDCCDEDIKKVSAKEFIEGLVRSHQHGYKKTKRGAHGPDMAVNDATFRSNDKKPGDYVDPNASANEYKYGYQKSVSDTDFGVPVMNLDGIARVSLKSAEVVPQKTVRAKGAREGGRSIAGHGRVGFKMN